MKLSDMNQVTTSRFKSVPTIKENDIKNISLIYFLNKTVATMTSGQIWSIWKWNGTDSHITAATNYIAHTRKKNSRREDKRW